MDLLRHSRKSLINDLLLYQTEWSLPILYFNEHCWIPKVNSPGSIYSSALSHCRSKKLVTVFHVPSHKRKCLLNDLYLNQKEWSLPVLYLDLDCRTVAVRNLCQSWDCPPTTTNSPGSIFGYHLAMHCRTVAVKN